MKIQVAPSFFESLKNLDSWKNKYYEVRCWFKYHFKKDFLNIIKTAYNGYPWQESFLYDLEKVKIIEMANYLERGDRFVDVENVVKYMRLAAKLITIFNEDETKLFHFTGDLKFKPIEGSNNYEMINDNLEYHCDINVNIKNIDRFIKNPKEKKYIIDHPHELYIRKAKYLYHKIRYEFDNRWWD